MLQKGLFVYKIVIHRNILSMAQIFDLSKLLAETSSISLKKQAEIVFKLSIPGMLAQISSILMQYIDAAMVGSLGPSQSAAIGLVASSTWVIGSLIHACCIGFTVQVAHAVGAGEKNKVKQIFVNSLAVCMGFSCFMALAGALLSRSLPLWLGAGHEIYKDAFWYFLIFSLSSPLFEIVYLMSGMLQCSGNMKFPGILNGAMCFFDMGFNWLFIFGLNMGVKGAALGSCAAAFLTALIMAFYTLFRSEYFCLKGYKDFSLDADCIKKAVKMAVPVGLESSAFSGALVVVTRIISPLGAVSLAANSFATTAESLCYMPGYGIQEAATTLVGQSCGAKRPDLKRSFSWITIIYGMTIMALIGGVMYFACPLVFKFITPDMEIQALSVKVLRIELFAEPLFGASIVAAGALRGRGDTLIPSALNLFSLWIVRLSLSLILVKPFGLAGIWIAMAAELCFRGLVLLIRVAVTNKYD